MNRSALSKQDKKILLLDDDEIDIFISHKIIKSVSPAHEVISKFSARDALDFLKGLSDTPCGLPDLIFLDLGMPGMDGFEFLNEFEKLPDIIKTTCEIVVLTNSLIPPPFATDEKKNFIVKKMILKPLTVEAFEEILIQTNQRRKIS